MTGATNGGMAVFMPYRPAAASPTPAMEPAITGPQKPAIKSLARRAGLEGPKLTDLLRAQFGTWRLERLTRAEAHDLHVALQRSLQDRSKDAGREGAPLLTGERGPSGGPAQLTNRTTGERTAPTEPPPSSPGTPLGRLLFGSRGSARSSKLPGLW